MRMSPRKHEVKLVLGGQPRADLLPPEIRVEAKARRQRRSIAAGLMGVLLIAVGGYALATAIAGGSQGALTNELARTDGLLLEKGRYTEVSRLAAQVDAAVTARQIATSTEVDWKTFLADSAALMPPEMSVATVSVTSATPMTPLDQAEGPLRPVRVVEIVFTARSSTLPDSADWLEAQQSLPGYVDASVTSINADGGAYMSNLTLHLDEEAYWNRFAIETENDTNTDTAGSTEETE
jgi:hypothetical protein